MPDVDPGSLGVIPRSVPTEAVGDGVSPPWGKSEPGSWCHGRLPPSRPEAEPEPGCEVGATPLPSTTITSKREWALLRPLTPPPWPAPLGTASIHPLAGLPPDTESQRPQRPSPCSASQPHRRPPRARHCAIRSRHIPETRHLPLGPEPGSVPAARNGTLISSCRFLFKQK